MAIWTKCQGINEKRLKTVKIVVKFPTAFSACFDLALLRFMQKTLNESTVDDFKLCHRKTVIEGRFPTRRFECIGGNDCQPREIRNDSVEAMRTALIVIKYIAVLCLPWIFPALVRVARKRRFAVIGTHLWQKLDGKVVKIEDISDLVIYRLT